MYCNFIVCLQASITFCITPTEYFIISISVVKFYNNDGGRKMIKVVLFAFNGEFMCFIHVLLNALDMNKKGYDVRIVIEGAATKLIPELATIGNPLYSLYKSVKEKNLIDGVCRACSHKMGALKDAEAEGLKLLDDMSGHPSMANYKEQGFEVIAF